MPEENEKFEVKDRRKILMGEDESSEAAAAGEAPAKEEKPKEEKPVEEAPAGPRPSAGGNAPAVDFIAFIGSLGGSALMYMGERLSPDQPPLDVNLPAAQQMIGVLDMLKLKTEGNLDEDERSSLDNLLYNLKMRYAHAAGAGK